MNTSTLDSEKVLLAKEILGINDASVLNEVKRRLAGVFNIKRRSKSDATDSVINAVSGKWKDSRDADTMVSDIYNDRTSMADDELISILNA